MQNLKKHKKEKTDTICEHTCANCSCQNVLFLCIFHFWVFCTFQFFSEMFLIGIKKRTKYESNKNQKQQEEENKMQSNKKSNMMIQNKARQQAEKQKQNNILKQKQTER